MRSITRSPRVGWIAVARCLSPISLPMLTVAIVAATPSPRSLIHAADEGRDLYGDPLPQGAVLRLGTIRLRHASNVQSVAFSPNGQTLATTGWMDPEIRLWDIGTGRLIRAFRGSLHDQPRVAVFSPNGARLAAVCQRGRVELWDVASGLEVREASDEHDREGINNLVFAPNGRSFVTASLDGAIRLWDADNSGRQRLLLQLKPQDQGHHALALSPDGKLLAIGVGPNIRFYDLGKGVESRKFEFAHSNEILTLAFAPDGKALFSAGDSEYRDVPGHPDRAECDPRLRMWDVASGKLIREFTDPGSEKLTCAAVLSRDGRTLVSRQANSIRFWDVASGKVTRTIPGFWLPSAASKKSIHMQFGFGGNSLAISPDGALVAATSAPFHAITLLDAATGLRKLDFPEAHCQRIEEIACSPDGSRIATAGGQDGTVRLWDGVSGKHLRTLVIGDSYPCAARSVAFSRDGKSIVAGGPNYKDGDTGIVRIWDVDSGKVRLELRPGVDVAKVALSHDGSTLAIATSNFSELRADRTGGKRARKRTLLLVDAKTGLKRRQIALRDYVRGLSFSANGATVSVVADDGEISTWDIAKGDLLRHGSVAGRVFSAAIADDGTLAAVSCLRREHARIWDLAQGKAENTVPFEVEGHIASVLAISSDNRLLASASIGGREESPEHDVILLSDLRSGRPLKRISRPPDNRVASMTFTPDGQRLISGMSDGTCLVWDVSKL